jgi:hypothetical protein
MTRPVVKLSALREIGWTSWDPIGLRALDSEWPADEYDSYLLVGFDMIQSGKSVDEVTAYLIEMASVNMGLSKVDGAAARTTAMQLLDIAKSLT